MAANSGTLDAVDKIINEFKDMAGPCLPILRRIQGTLGHVPADALPRVANALNLSRAEVYGVFSFYHDLQDAPGGRHTLHLCRAEACQAMGARDLEAAVRSRLGVDFGGTTRDGAVTLKAAYCLGNCALSPAVMVDSRLYGKVDTTRANALIDSLTDGRTVPHG